MDYFLWLNYRSNIFLNFQPDDEAETCAVEDITADVIIKVYLENEGEISGDVLEEKAGYLTLHYYNIALAVNNNMNIFDAFDRSMDTIEMGETIIDYDTGNIKEEIIDQIGTSFQENILVIHDFGIFPKFRNKGIGEKVIKGLIEHYRGKCGFIVLKSFPKQFEAAYARQYKGLKDMELHLLENKKQNAQRKLNAFYKRCGFTELKKSRNFFIKNMNTL